AAIQGRHQRLDQLPLGIRQHGSTRHPRSVSAQGLDYWETRPSSAVPRAISKVDNAFPKRTGSIFFKNGNALAAWSRNPVAPSTSNDRLVIPVFNMKAPLARRGGTW
ncbi:hypothetical protein, partial [Georgenia daeguensis]|uniref:hypothetical protein n=1 Tax=Georgenia daeguensis TaxID=908355 RepID=UPI0031EC2A29